MHCVEIKNISKLYQTAGKDVPAVSHLSFSAEEGDFIAITGPSGCGKSTLLHIIAGLDSPSGGHVIIYGKDLYKKTEKQLAEYRRRTIGIIYQFYNLVPELTVEENIMLPLMMEGQTIDSQQLNSILCRIGLSEKRTCFPGQLSGGEQQRAAIGRALMSRPKILLADEPTGHLDSKNRNEILALFQAINIHDKVTVLLVTHDPIVAKSAKRRLYMSDGRLTNDEVI